MDIVIFLVIIFVCLIKSFIRNIVKVTFDCIQKLNSERSSLLTESRSLKLELSKINMRQDYINYVKTERKILAIQQKLKIINEKYQRSDSKIMYGTNGALTFILIVISIYYRYEPVLIFDSTTKFDLIPFGAIMSFPTGINGAVSIPFWILITRSVTEHFASFFVKSDNV